jgi:phospholipase/carboxylesterase
MPDMMAPAPRERGLQDEAMPLAWRLDGRAADPQAPLLLCLHGYGMNEDFFAGLLQSLFDLPWNIVIPRAPLVAADVKGRGHSWYDYDGNQERFRAELHRTDGLVQSFLQRLEDELGLRPTRRILLGFSQGGYCGSYVALRNPLLFRGMIISGARVKVEILPVAIAVAARAGFRALLCHGDKDRSVPLDAAQSSLEGLRRAGVHTELQQFESGHSMGRSQVAAIRHWLTTLG